MQLIQQLRAPPRLTLEQPAQVRGLVAQHLTLALSLGFLTLASLVFADSVDPVL